MGIREAWNRLVYGDARPGPAVVVGEARGLGASVPPYAVGRAQWPTQNVETYRREGYNSAPVVYACVNVRAKAVSAATVRVYRAGSGGQRRELPDHPLRQLLQRPNPGMSETEFLLLTVLMMDAAGFCALEKVRSAAGRVVELWHLRPDWIKPVPREQRPPDWQYRVPGREPRLLKAEDVVVVQGGPALDLGYTGLSPIAVALREIGIENASTDFLKLFMDRGGVPQYVLTTKGAIKDQAEADRYKEAWQQTYGSFRNWAKIGILDREMDIKQVGMDLDAMAYPELRRLTEAHICMAFGVPPILIGSQVGLERATYSNYAEARRTFYEDTITPLWARIDGALTRGLLPEVDPAPDVSLEFDVSEIPALQDDENAAWARATTALAAGGITIDEFRAEVGLPALPKRAGKLLLLPFSVTPMRPEDLVAAAEESAAPPEPVPPQLAAPAGDAEPEQEPDGADAGDAEPEADERAAFTVRAARGWRATPQTRAALHARSKARISKLARLGAPKLRRFWAEQGERVAAAATRAAGTRDLTEIDWDEEEEELGRVLRPFYDLNGQTAFRDVAETVGVELTWDLGNPKVRQVAGRLAKRIVGISATTRDDVARIVAQSVHEGVAMDELAARLKDLFTETYRGRALTVARTESQVAYNSASVLGYQESRVVGGGELMDNPDHGGYDGDGDGLTCQQRNGMEVPLETAHVHIEGTHPNCILAVAPILVAPLGGE